MIDPVHLHFALHAPAFGAPSCSQLFSLLDGLAPDIRDDLLVSLYLGYDIFNSEQDDSQRYRKFKETFLAANAKCKDETIVVFGLVSYLLAEAYRKSDFARFERIIGSHRDSLKFAREQLRKEELPASRMIEQVYTVEASIDGLHREIEASRKTYKAFCDQVVSQLLPQRG